jgi:hypothetical protein
MSRSFFFSFYIICSILNPVAQVLLHLLLFLELLMLLSRLSSKTLHAFILKSRRLALMDNTDVSSDGRRGSKSHFSGWFQQDRQVIVLITVASVSAPGAMGKTLS